MRKFKVLKLPNVSESASPIYYKRKRYTNVLFHKIFFPKNGGGPGGPTQAQSACPHSLEKKTFYWKELLCTVWICKKWDWRFLKHLAVLTFCICACLSICSLQKNWIRIFCTFIPIPKEWIRAFFARAFFWQKITSMLLELF